MLQTDSIQNNTRADVEQIVAEHHGQPTPAQIISWLPKNATPALQDSAIQAHVKPHPINWSQRPDTLHLPDYPIGKSVYDYELPEYEVGEFVSPNGLFHTSEAAEREGLAGEPIPYSISGDNFMTSLLLLCFMATIIALSALRGVFHRQMKQLFRTERANGNTAETANEMRLQVFLALQACLMYAVICFLYFKTYVAETFMVEQFQMIGLLFGLFVLYFLLQAIMYSLTNYVFFDTKKNSQWLESKLFLLACQGTLLLPLVMMLAYFGLSVRNSVICLCAVVFLSKLLAICKQRNIFFPRNGQIVGFFLYLCTHEIVPIFVICSVLTMVSDSLKVNF